MKLLSPKIRITMGLVGVMTSLIMLAFFLNVIPDSNGPVRQGRAALAEAIAVYSSALVKSAKSQRLRDDFSLLTDRNEDLLSLALRRENGTVLVATGDHLRQWEAMTGEYLNNSQVVVPVWNGGQKWGRLELRFKPMQNKGLRGLLQIPLIQMTLFMGVATFVIFYFYLGKVLRQLDPSQAIPGRVRAALDTMAEGLLILDRKEQIVLANEAFASMIDRSAEGLLGYRAGELPWMNKAGERIEKAQRPWIRSLRRGEVQKDSIIRLQLSNAPSRTFKTNCSPVLGSGGKYAGVLVSFNDITELEEKEVELLKSKMEAEKANNAKSSFLANMSHEIRTPMNAILGFTEILKRGYVKNEKESLKYLNTIHSSGKNLLELINDILDLSKVESGHLEIEKSRVDPYAIIHEVLQMLTVKADEKGIVLALKADGQLPAEIETDPARLRQIAFNLIGNSIKFTEVGSVTVTCRYRKTASGSWLILDITDTGIGMSKDALENIFDPFVQADNTVTRRFGGTGLGLAISLKFARALGGDIKVNSQIGKGSTFRVSLDTGNPAELDFLPPEAINDLQKEIAAEDHCRWELPPARVIIVDDGKENRELVKLLLNEAGLFVDEAHNGQQGIEKIAAGRFDVVLMDVQMPVMDGFTAVKLLRKQGFDIPVIALTANAMKGFEDRCLAAGFTGYLSKPLDIDRFMERMARILGGRKLDQDSDSTPVLEISQPDQQTERPKAKSSPIVSKLPLHKPVVSRLASMKRLQPTILSFIDTLNEKMPKMETALKKEDMSELAGLAHWLKGAGGTVGFDDFTGPAAALESCARSGHVEMAAETLKEVQSLAGAVVPPDVDAQPG